MSKIFLIIDRKQQGPFSNEEVHGKLVAREIDGSTFARLDEGSEWFPLSNFIDTSAFPNRPANENPNAPRAIPVLIWIIAILYIGYYLYSIGRIGWFLMRFPNAASLSFAVMFGTVLFDAILKITAAILLLMLRSIAVVLLIVAFLFDAARLGYVFFLHSGPPRAAFNPTLIITLWTVHIAVLIYTGFLVKNRTLR